VSELSDEFTDRFGQSAYPAGFLDRFEPLECLGSSAQGETLLVRERSTGEKFVAKCYPRSPEREASAEGSGLLTGLEHPGLPRFAGEFLSETMRCVVRQYREGAPLSQFVQENTVTTAQLISFGAQLCDILTYLHSQTPPVIHRDVKPQNIIVGPDGRVSLIDFGIARSYRAGARSDTACYGTEAFSPPEQYGFSQTDCRSDIYSLGVVLCWVLTRRTDPADAAKGAENRSVAKILRRCTAFDPKNRYADARAVRRALLRARPEIAARRRFLSGLCAGVLLAGLVFGGVKLYEKLTYSPFTDSGYVNTMQTDPAVVADAVAFLKQRHGATDLFDNTDDYATVGWVKDILVDLYRLDETYVRAKPLDDSAPHESDHNFLPWAQGDEQYMNYYDCAYIVVKLFWPDKVADWSSLRDDNGEYPGSRVADAFLVKNGLRDGVVRPTDLMKGELAILFANTERFYLSQR